MNPNVTRVLLKPKEDREINQGFPWIFDNEIASVKYNAKDGTGVKTSSLAECDVDDGTVVEVCTNAGGFLGTGVINRKSKITIRIFSREHADKIMADTYAYWDKVIRNAVNIRALSFDVNDSYRLVFGEADFVPGLICERYVDDGNVYIVIQFLALACEVFRKEILKAIENVCKPYAIFERSDAGVREKEGLEEKSGWIGRQGKEVITIVENGIQIEVDIARGQKTGYFLDQKFNRARVAEFCRGKKVLDTFTHTGAFGLNAFKAGARDVTSVDISEDAVELVNRNIKNNGAEKVVKAVCADVFDVLKKYETEGEKFDVIILDPPAFTKKAKAIEKAYGGYKEINLRAMRILNEGGILVTCSCSHYFDENTFYDMIMHAAKDSHRRVQVLEKRGAAPDHPVLLGYPKSEYLKCAICRVL
ncbi:MAG: class I SAM-dependent rRNA methyltransferase [Spirochaetales bacterium]|nr:class I SAM-dependent rRNA methyltransferase [Spirochaetales bacterium]